VRYEVSGITCPGMGRVAHPVPRPAAGLRARSDLAPAPAAALAAAPWWLCDRPLQPCPCSRRRRQPEEL